MQRVFCVILLGAVFCGNVPASPSERPNIVLVMADDMGFEALSVNGSESCQTPNLDELAAEGVRFTNCFANPLCTPSRAKLMTGQYNVRNYVKFGRLERGQTTFAHPLKEAGYATCISGKWQLGRELDSPQHFGFQQSFLWQHTRSGRSKEGKITYDRRFVNPLLEFNGEEKNFVGGEYGPQLCTDFLCEFIEKQSQRDQPFLIYYPMILTHCPFDPTPDSADWNPERLGSTTYKGDLKDPQRHFTEMVAYADKLMGQLIKQLETSGVRQNTLIVFTGDNGTDEPIRTRWQGREVVGGKGTMTDEGTRVPMIANWPTGIRNPGRVANDLVEFCDIFPTLCEVGEAKVPAKYPGDGSSLLPILKDQSSERIKEWIYIWYGGKVMVRDQKYSLLAKADGSEMSLTRYRGAFTGETLSDGNLTDAEFETKRRFQATMEQLGKQRLKSVDKPVKKPSKKKKRK